MDLRGRHLESHRQHRQHSRGAARSHLPDPPTSAPRTPAHRHARSVRIVDVDRECILRHVRIVQAEAADLLAFRPRLQTLQILAQPVREHLRSRPARPSRHAPLQPGRSTLAAVSSKRSSRHSIGPLKKRCVRLANIPRFLAKCRIAREYRRLPALELLAQDLAHLRVQRRQSGFRADALAVRWIQRPPSPSRRRPSRRPRALRPQPTPASPRAATQRPRRFRHWQSPCAPPGHRCPSRRYNGAPARAARRCSASARSPCHNSPS
jgi:hypothetical protein